MPPRVHPWALGAFALYLSGGLLLGERFPFSRFSMYADVGVRDHGAVPIFLVDGEAAEPSAYAAFHGLDPARFAAPAGVATTLGYLVAERAAWVAAHPADAPGPARVTIGYDLVHVEDGALVRERHVTDEGTAWP